MSFSKIKKKKHKIHIPLGLCVFKLKPTKRSLCLHSDHLHGRGTGTLSSRIGLGPVWPRQAPGPLPPLADARHTVALPVLAECLLLQGWGERPTGLGGGVLGPRPAGSPPSSADAVGRTGGRRDPCPEFEALALGFPNLRGDAEGDRTKTLKNTVLSSLKK